MFPEFGFGTFTNRNSGHNKQALWMWQGSPFLWNVVLCQWVI